MKNILIVGSTGFLGSSLMDNLKDKSLSIDYTTRSILDLARPITHKFREYLENRKFNYVIICAAVADVEKCYNDQLLSQQINVKGMIDLLNTLKSNGVIPIFFSTDYVFSGKETPYKEDDRRNPLTLYGRQKCVIEEYIETNFTEYLIFRTSKLMSKTSKVKNILYPVIQNLINKKETLLFEDQLLNPIFVEDIARVLVVSILNELTGVFHLGTKKVFTRAELGRFLAKSLGYDSSLIKSTYMKDRSFSELRPTNNTLDCHKIEKAIGFYFCEVKDAMTALKKMSDEFYAQKGLTF